jgi:hypothetical protein
VLAYQVAVWWAWIAVSWLVATVARRLPVVPPRARNLLLHLGLAVVVSTLHAVWWVSLVLLIRPYDVMNPTGFAGPFATTATFQLPLELLLYGGVVLATFAGDGYARQRERERQATQLERLLAEARLHALELQLQPHFVFNTLNSIGALVRTGESRQAVAMIAGLADLLRYALDRSGNQRVAMAEEAEMVRRYLEIQRLRFPDRLSYEVEIEPEARSAAVPVLLLQPLAENAIRHGVAPHAGPGRVRVHAFRQDGRLRIELWNSGRRLPEAPPGIGIANTRSRLRALYGDDQGFELRDADGGVVASVTLPWSEVA